MCVGWLVFFFFLFSFNSLRQMPGLENVSSSGESGKLQAAKPGLGEVSQIGASACALWDGAYQLQSSKHLGENIRAAS